MKQRISRKRLILIRCWSSTFILQCVCDAGFSGNGTICQDIDECSDDPTLCDNGQCLNYPGSFRCECEMGFMHPDERNEQSCVGTLSSAALIPHNIYYHITYWCCCNVTADNWYLIIPLIIKGNHTFVFVVLIIYVGNQTADRYLLQSFNIFSFVNDVDIDECLMFSNLCVFGQCENIYGMFRCICDKGFQLDESGGNCTDIDECENPQACQYGNCINSQGNYVCQCPPHHDLIPSENGCVGQYCVITNLFGKNWSTILREIGNHTRRILK